MRRHYSWQGPRGGRTSPVDLAMPAEGDEDHLEKRPETARQASPMSPSSQPLIVPEHPSRYHKAAVGGWTMKPAQEVQC
jgi:hypothetical protein